jgi:thioredoxin 1
VKKFRNFETMLEAYNDKPILVSFHAKYCGPCKLVKKELKAVRDEMGDDVHLFAVDTEKFPSVAARYEVAGLPTLVIFYQGEILYRVEGVESAENLVHRVRSLI